MVEEVRDLAILLNLFLESLVGELLAHIVDEDLATFLRHRLVSERLVRLGRRLHVVNCLPLVALDLHPTILLDRSCFLNWLGLSPNDWSALVGVFMSSTVF